MNEELFRIVTDFKILRLKLWRLKLKTPKGSAQAYALESAIQSAIDTEQQLELAERTYTPL